MALPRIAITAGEPAGIGPDILLAIAQQEWDAELVAVADPDLLKRRAELLGLPLNLRDWDPARDAAPHVPGKLSIAPVRLAEAETPGQLNPANAACVVETLQLAVEG